MGTSLMTEGRPIAPEEVLAALDRVLASSEFAASAQLARFLRYVVENSLAGDSARLKESAIGVTVFNRGAGYDPKVDPIVRVEARRMRARLESYYSHTGSSDAIRISLPKGGYAPAFESRPRLETPPPAPLPEAKPRVRPFLALILSAAVLLAAAVFSIRRDDRIVSSFWSGFLQSGPPALLVPADSGLVMLQDLAHQPVQLQEYLTGEYRARLATLSRLDSGLAFGFAGRRYTSIADLEFAARLSRRPEARSGLITRYARDVRVEDLKRNNLILLGARHSNPWVELFEKDASFRLEHDEATSVFRIVNTRPQSAEPTVITITPEDSQHEIYGLVTWHRNREGSGNVLMVAGTTVAGTEAAADFVLDDVKLLPWLHKARNGSQFRGFDILLHARNLAGSAPHAEVAAFHIDSK
jgi:hypothetical protein